MGRGARPRVAPRRAVAGSSPLVPFAGELLLWAAGALRLSVIRSGDADTSEATAKRVAAGSASVRGERIRVLSHSLIGALFEEPYLAARGFGSIETDLLLVQLTAVLEWFLEQWDVLATGANHIGPPFVFLAGHELCLESALRLSALCTRYPFWHLDLLACASHWEGSGISGALKALRSSCPRPPSEQALYERAGIAKNTFKSLRDGKRLPQEENVLRLASALAHFGAQRGEGARSEADIRFSLRGTCQCT